MPPPASYGARPGRRANPVRHTPPAADLPAPRPRRERIPAACPALRRGGQWRADRGAGRASCSTTTTWPTATPRSSGRCRLTAIHNYEANYGYLPADIRGADGKPLLSWRVALLPYLEQDGLYRRFQLNEPWDSEHNLKVL